MLSHSISVVNLDCFPYFRFRPFVPHIPFDFYLVSIVVSVQLTENWRLAAFHLQFHGARHLPVDEVRWWEKGFVNGVGILS